MNIVFEAFDVKPAATTFVVVTVLETTRFAKGCVIFAEFMFEIADPFEEASRPDTVSPVKVPTEVIFV